MLSIVLLLSSSITHASDGDCAEWSEAEAAGEVAVPELAELSGLTASRVHAGVFWAHADSGNETRLYALTPDGELLGVLEVTQADNDDWEDIASGPCPEDDRDTCACLFIADAGDNELERDASTLYRLSEPDPDADTTDAVVATWFSWPDGPHDAEALLVHPLTGEALMVTKERGPSKLYTFAHTPPEAASEAAPETLRYLGELDVEALGAADNEVTGGDVSPDGRWAVLRTPGSLLFFPIGDGETLAEALEGTPTVTDAPDVELGEAVAFSAQGDGLLLGDEGDLSALWSLDCEDFTAVDSPTPHPMLDCELDDDDDDKECGCVSGPARSTFGWLLLPLLLTLRARRGPQPAG